MKIIFAQGNPGTQYAATRHNIGFVFVDALAKSWGIEFAKKPKFNADIAETTLDGQKVLLVKPTTFYNETGQSARLLVDFYKLDPSDDFLVIHDDLALPFGTIRTREQGRDAGNNGIKSLNAHIGEQHKRLRVGIYNPLRDRMHDADFVIGKFTADEQAVIPHLVTMSTPLIDGFIRGQFKSTKLSLPTTPNEATE